MRGQRIKGGKRLVEKQQLRLLHKRPRKGDALRLPAGQIAGPVIEPVAETDFDECIGRALAWIINIKTQRNVAPQRIPRQQPVLLKHDCRTARRIDTSALNWIQTRKGRATAWSCRSRSRPAARRILRVQCAG